MSLLYVQVCSNHLESRHWCLCHRKSKRQLQGYRNRHNLNDRLSGSCNFCESKKRSLILVHLIFFFKSLYLFTNLNSNDSNCSFSVLIKIIPVSIALGNTASNQTSSGLRYTQWVIKPIKTLMISLY